MDFIKKVKDKLEERPECQDKVIFVINNQKLENNLNFVDLNDLNYLMKFINKNF